MNHTRDAALPAYTGDAVRQRLLGAGASGTIYALVMPETEAALCAVLDRREELLGLYREPWARRQDGLHVQWFDEWIRWASPAVLFDHRDFVHRYPTAGASEGIYKVMAEWAARSRKGGGNPIVHVFQGEYEGFRSYAETLHLQVVEHDRSNWREACDIPGDGQFWISQPSAIDGMVWEDFDEFAHRLARISPNIDLVPDLSYVGAVARDYQIPLDAPNIRTVVVSQSKPGGLYYHRIGGVLSKREIGALKGNVWFKNLLSLAIGTEMMRRHAVHELPRRYRAVQEQAAREVGASLGVAGLAPADIMVMATAPAQDVNDSTRTLLRGSADQQVIRVCITPTMSYRIDPAMAPMMEGIIQEMDAA